MSTINTPQYWTVPNHRGEQVLVSPRRAAEAASIDADADGVLSDDEIVDYMRKNEILRAEPAKADLPRITEEFKAHLTGTPVATARGDMKNYRSLAEIEARMHELAAEHPDRCKLISIGHTHEGRDVWALKVSSGAQGDTTNKPGVVFTGAHHAREWMTPEVTLGMAEDMVENYDRNADAKRRVDNAETWFLPVVNPDGFAYSQTEDNMWRKNRTPIPDVTQPEGKPLGYGVDLNRNYWDGKPEHMFLYRHADDTPSSTWDDYGASDSPRSDSFRGRSPASEAEVQGLIAFEQAPNIRGVVDHHSYGNLLLRPWDDRAEDPENVKDYDEVAGRMLAAQGKDAYQYMRTYDLYPVTGASIAFNHVNGRFAFGIEMGESFQPWYSDFPNTYKTVSSADFAFLDWIIEKSSPVTPAPTTPEPPSGN